MNKEALDRIEIIFHAALEVPAAERDAFLDRECGADTAAVISNRFLN